MPGFSSSKWENSGAFPSRDKGRPILPKKSNIEPAPSHSSNSSEGDKIFEDGFESTFDIDKKKLFDTLATVKEGSREKSILSSTYEGLMTVSHSSTETPAISNTTTSVVRNAVKKSKETQNSGSAESSRVQKVYPYNVNVFRSMACKNKDHPLSQQEGGRTVSTNPKDQGFATATATATSTTTPSGTSQPSKTESKRGTDRPSPRRSPPIPSPLLSAVEDELSSIITEDHHQQEPTQYVYDYMADNQHPPMSIASARSRRGGSKHHMVRHTLATTQKISANPSNMLKNLFISIEEERHLHRLTAQHLRAIHNWFLFLPSILLTLVAGLVVLIFEADINSSDEVRVFSSIGVGVLCMVSVFWQALGKQLDLGVKSSLHDSCSVALKRLSEDILLTMSSAPADSIPAEYVALIGEKYGQAADACPFPIPYKLEAAAAHLSDRMILMLRPPLPEQPLPASLAQKHKNFDLLRLYATAYDELTTEVIHFVGFPFAIPDPRATSEAALRSFKSIVTEGKEVDRCRCCHHWRSIFPCLEDPEQEPGLFDVLQGVEGDSIYRSQRSF
eukprot:CAMPEP_0172391484 /NCGR_PEP_ID=MMETSP1061-20121228/7879_1 /TAXON_ID=37318 /ORGANISM="Pseudo-nitzschia pungens, Strain cf. pungens" /LENGTH=559 /DNA_ID=CAMNT_0013122117 /DNA_START=78 /DNA_END=1757 /DNA_ORIENTATION=-